VRHIGVSNFTVAHLQELLPHARIKPAVLQIELHPYLPQHELVDFCRANQIHVRANKKIVHWDIDSLYQWCLSWCLTGHPGHGVLVPGIRRLTQPAGRSRGDRGGG